MAGANVIFGLGMLETYEPPKLSDDVLKTVRTIVKEAEGELGVDGGDV